MSILRRIESALRRSDEAAFIRADFSMYGGYAQVSRALQIIVAKGLLVRVGHGAYVKARPSDDGEPVPVLSTDEIDARIELKRAVATRKARRRRLDDIELNAIADARDGQKVVKVRLDEL